MRIRRVIITQESSFANIDALQQHPNVMKYWRVPKRYALFEFYHPVYDHIYDNNPAISNTAWQAPSIKLQAAEAVEQEKALLAPLYREVGNPSNAGLLLVPSRTAMYYFLGTAKGRIEWPFLGRSPDWETSHVIKIVGQIPSINPARIEELRIVIRCWEESMRGFGEPVHLDELEFYNSRFSLLSRFTAECGDATMLLFMLLAESRHLICLEAVGFFLLDDIYTPFNEIGGSSKIPQ